ncbi:MAG: hypothetical protein V2I54_13685 [Bacteroidales bacterium]|jgi:hypothetical protein|nr:hypothetical protein [Bacteroidales bacterium]
MKKKRLSKRQLWEKQKNEDKNFNKTMLISFGLVFLFASLILLLVYWCDVRYTYRKFALYGKSMPRHLVCMSHDGMIHHESSKIVFKNKTYFVCSHSCHNHIERYYKEHAFTTDAYSGDTISKADAIIGLKVKGEPVIVYFKNKRTLNKYYEAKNK